MTGSRAHDGWPALGRSLARSAAPSGDDVRGWLAEEGRRVSTRADVVPLESLDGWEVEPGSGNIRHRSGRFFSVEGLTATGTLVPGRPEDDAPWAQPVIHQPEVGILGIVVKDVGGVPHFLMQAKDEPGNPAGVQLSPTVQATRSNYTRVHRGRPVPYLDCFREAPPDAVLVDVRQSEQGAWFYRKRNRNMVVRVDDEVEAQEGFRWLTLGQVVDLVREPSTVNMDARSVLACLPLPHGRLADAVTAETGLPDAGGPADAFGDAVARSFSVASPTVHDDRALLHWITDVRSREVPQAALRPLGGLPGWRWEQGRIRHDSGGPFEIVGVDVRADGREVARWSQPMLAPVGQGVVAFLARQFDGVVHVLVRMRAEPGSTDVAELGPTVHALPYEGRAVDGSGAGMMAEVLASPDRIRFDTVLSEEGGRFYGAGNRYLVVETDAEVPHDDPDHRWVSARQLCDLLRHSFYVNVEARTLLTCLMSLLPR